MHSQWETLPGICPIVTPTKATGVIDDASTWSNQRDGSEETPQGASVHWCSCCALAVAVLHCDCCGRILCGSCAALCSTCWMTTCWYCRCGCGEDDERLGPTGVSDDERDCGKSKTISHQFQQQPTGACWCWPSVPLDEVVPGFAGNKDLVGQRESDNAAALFATASLVVALTSGTDGNAVLMIHIDRSLSRFSFETESNCRPLMLRCFSVTAGGRSALGWGFTGIGAAVDDQTVSGLGLEVGQENQICDDQRLLPTAALGRHF